MYKEYFGLKETPFSIAPDPRYLYMSEGHREALAHLEYGMRGDGGFVLLTGEVGTGKTTVCRCLLEQVPDGSDVAFVLNPKLTAEELLATVCDEFGISYPEGNTSVKVFVDRINDFLIDSHSRGRRAILIIEEAQNLHPGVLEQLRLLTNLETNRCKLLQIVLIGQPELREMLARPEMSQLAQRITARYHLGPLSMDELAAYVSHRLTVAGGYGKLFPAATLRKIFRITGGIPRMINVLCDRALLGAYVQGKDRVDRATIAKAAKEVFAGTRRMAPLLKRYGTIIAGGLFILLGTVLAAYYISAVGNGRNSPGPANGDTGYRQASSDPRLDTLWWFDSRSLPGRSLLKQRGRMLPGDQLISEELSPRSPFIKGQEHEPKHRDAAAEPGPDPGAADDGKGE